MTTGTQPRLQASDLSKSPNPIARHYSRFLALQLKARLEGIATPVYARGKVHHKA